MNTSNRQRWIRTAILFGAVYAVIGIVLAAPTNSAPADQVRIWRLTAWVVSALAFAAHLWYEHFRVRNSALRTALHMSLAVALGAFGLAASANVDALWVGSNHQRLLTFARRVACADRSPGICGRAGSGSRTRTNTKEQLVR
jgi:hypothetical protein